MEDEEKRLFIESLTETVSSSYPGVRQWIRHNYDEELDPSAGLETETVSSSYPGVRQWIRHNYDEELDPSAGLEVDPEDLKEYLVDRTKYRKQTRLLAQRKKECNSLKSKLKRRVKKYEDLITQIKILTDRYGHLKNSAELIASSLFKETEDV